MGDTEINGCYAPEKQLWGKTIMHLNHLRYLAMAAALLAAMPTWGQSHSTEPLEEEVYTYGEQGKTDTATKLELTVFETPQTVTSISRAQLDDFALDTINDVLDYTPGVTVEEVETDRTYYTARGFDIVNFQYDGVGIPFISGINLGQQDTAIYEKVEVVKGAAGLITGLANPSATINYVRKRPTEELKMAAGLSLGEWNSRRIDADVSGSLSSNIRGRAVVAYDDAESYLDRHEDETQLAYGIVEFDLSASTLLTIGHSYDNSHSTGVLWGALPLVYSDGTQTDYDVSTSNAPEWTFADATQNQTFAELTQTINDHWAFNAIYTRNESEYESELFYVYGTPDPADETGLNGWASAYNRDEEQDNIDAFFSGLFMFAGREHQIVVGYSHSKTQLNETSYSDLQNGFPVLGSDWAEGNTPPLNFNSHDPANQASNIKVKQEAYYLATRFNILDKLSLLLGARNNDIEQRGTSYGGEANADGKKTVPYYGITYQIIDDIMLYGSYSEVFKQQTWVNAELRPLGPTLGESSEIGVKKSFNDERAVLTLALFNSDQSNFGEFVGRNENSIAIYTPRAYESQGYEIELTGEFMEGLNIGAGYTDVEVEDEQGNTVRPFVPSKLIKLSASYRLPVIPDLKIGGVIKWQDEITTAGDLVKQDAYTLVDLAAQYQLLENLSVSLNIENIADEKYLNSLYWDQAYYGAPRNVKAAVRWKF